MLHIDSTPGLAGSSHLFIRRTSLRVLVVTYILLTYCSAFSSGAANAYSALCAIGRDENVYVKEWVEYHKCLGFSRIYLYDHGSSVPMSTVLQDHIESGFVTYINYNASHTKFREGFTSNLERFMTTAQGQAYRHCARTYGPAHTFLGFIDIDEFFVFLTNDFTDISQYLKKYEAYAGVAVYWSILGSSGQKSHPKGAYVVDTYTHCLPANSLANTQFKSFVNTRFNPTMYSPHRAKFNSSEPNSYLVREDFMRVPSGRNKESVHLQATVYHYATKSEEDFKRKLRRGGGAGVTRSRSYMQQVDKRSSVKCLGAQQTRGRLCKV